jgi:hypothetical protein
MLSNVLQFAIKTVQEDDAVLNASLRDLAARHNQYGILVEWYDIMGTLVFLFLCLLSLLPIVVAAP